MLFSLMEVCHRPLPACACSWCGNPSTLWVQCKQQVERKKMKPGHSVGLKSWRGLEGILIYNCVSPQCTGNVWYSRKPGSVQVCMANHLLYLAVQVPLLVPLAVFGCRGCAAGPTQHSSVWAAVGFTRLVSAPWAIFATYHVSLWGFYF